MHIALIAGNSKYDTSGPDLDTAAFRMIVQDATGVLFCAMLIEDMKGASRVAIFDIDGTIFRSSLLIEITEALIDAGVFPEQTRTVYQDAYFQWLDRQGPYEDYIGAVVRAFEDAIVGVSHAVFHGIVKDVVAVHKHRTYRYTRDLVRDLKKQGYFLLAISHSPREAVEEFANKLGFDEVYARIHEVDERGFLTGNTMFADFISNKAQVLRRAAERHGLTLDDSVGVGDTESDVSFLEIVTHPVCFNPNHKLYSHAQEHGWKVVVERKDVIYEL